MDVIVRLFDRDGNTVLMGHDRHVGSTAELPRMLRTYRAAAHRDMKHRAVVRAQIDMAFGPDEL